MSLIFITFIFTLPNAKSNMKYFGKYYTDSILHEHEGLDVVVKPYLLKGLSHSFEKKTFEEINKKINIGVLSVSNCNTISIHSTDEEINSFDFYCEKFTINQKVYLKIYMFGKLIENTALVSSSSASSTLT
jgi:hypothetical protein